MKLTLVEIESVDSTNSYALDLQKKGYPSGTVVFAKSQNAGRGRWQRSWMMSEGDLAMSVLLAKPHLPQPLSLLSLIPALAVIDVLAYHQVSSYIKWPNDIVIKSKHNKEYAYFSGYQKLAGILVENVWSENEITASVIGIGVNIVKSPVINHQVAHAVSLADLGLALKAYDLLLYIVKALEHLLEHAESDFIFERYQKNCVSLGSKLTLQYKNQAIVGVGCGLNKDGSLQVRSGDVIHNIYAGDVNFYA